MAYLRNPDQFALTHASKDSLIHFNMPGRQIVTGMADGAPEPAQRRSKLVERSPTKEFDAPLLQEYNFRLRPCAKQQQTKQSGMFGVMKARARRGRAPVAARVALPLAILTAPAIGTMTRLAPKPVLLSNPVKVGGRRRHPKTVLETRHNSVIIAARLGSSALIASAL